MEKPVDPASLATTTVEKVTAAAEAVTEEATEAVVTEATEAVVTEATKKPDVSSENPQKQVSEWIHVLPLWLTFRVYAFVNTYGEKYAPYFKLKCNGDEVLGFVNKKRAAGAIGSWLFKEEEDCSKNEEDRFAKWLTDVVEKNLCTQFKIRTVATERYLYYARRPTVFPSLGGAAHLFAMSPLISRFYEFRWNEMQSMFQFREGDDDMREELDFTKDIYATWLGHNDGLSVVVYGQRQKDDARQQKEDARQQKDEDEVIARVSLKRHAIDFIIYNAMESLFCINGTIALRKVLAQRLRADSVLTSASCASDLAVVDVVPRILFTRQWTNPIDALRFTLEVAPVIYSTYVSTLHGGGGGGASNEKFPTALELLDILERQGKTTDEALKLEDKLATVVFGMLMMLENMALEFSYNCSNNNDITIRRNVVPPYFQFRHPTVAPIFAKYPTLRRAHVLKFEPSQTYHFFSSMRISAAVSMLLRSV